MQNVFVPLTKQESEEGFLDKLDEVSSFFSLKGSFRDKIRKIQKIWKFYGLYKGEIDGIWGPLTEEAYHKWLKNKELQRKVNYILSYVGKEIDVDGLIGRETKKGIKEAQSILKRLGLYKGKIDGIWGPLTEKAYKLFKENIKDSKSVKIDESKMGRKVNGEIDFWGKIYFKVAQERAGKKLPVVVVKADGKVGEAIIFDEDGNVIRRMPVSLSVYGLGFRRGSGKTPTGLFFVKPNRKPREGVYSISNITKTPVFNVFWPMEGLDEENDNSSMRGIGIHGVSKSSQDSVGKVPKTKGCVALRKQDLDFLWESFRDKGFLMVIYPKNFDPLLLTSSLFEGFKYAKVEKEE